MFDYQKCLNDAEEAFNAEKLHEALNIYKNILRELTNEIERDPSNFDLYRRFLMVIIRVGDIYRNIGRQDSALKTYRAASYLSNALIQKEPEGSSWSDILSLVRESQFYIEPRMNQSIIDMNKIQYIQDNTGIPKNLIINLYEDVSNNFPESDVYEKVNEALDQLKKLSSQKFDNSGLNDDVRITLEAAERKLVDTWNVDAAVAVLDPLIENTEHSMLAVAQASKQKAQMYAVLYRFDEAIMAYETAARYDPENYVYWVQIGDIRVHRGNLVGALDAFNRALEIASAHASEREVSVCHNRIGDIRTAQGNLTAALEAYQAGLNIRDTLAKADPNNTEWQRDLSVGHDRIGDIRTAQGDLAAALDAYQAGLEIADALAKADPDNIQWQRDLSVSHNKIGDIRKAQGNLAAALDAYQAGLEIADALAKADPHNTEWERDLSVSHNRIGDIRKAQGNLAAALDAYQAALEIADALAKADPHNTQWQRDLSVSHNKIGNIRTAQGNLAAALDAYQAGLEIADALAKADPHNTEWQRDLSVSYDRIGDIRTAQGDLAAALDAYQAALDIADALAKADPNNTLWQRDLSVSHNRIGDIRTAQGDLTSALEAYQNSLNIRDTLAKADPNNTEWQRDLIVSHVKLAEAGGDAGSHYRQALEIAERLQAEGKLAPVDAFISGMLRERLRAAEGE